MKSLDVDSIAFADAFAEDYKNIPAEKDITFPGIKYTIQYLESIIDYFTGKPIKPLLRVAHASGRIQIDRTELLSNKKYSKNFVFFMVLWGMAMIENEFKTFESDIIALAEYTKRGKSQKELIVGLAELFKTAPTEMNKKRMENIIGCLKQEG